MFVFCRNIINEWWQQQHIQHSEANFMNRRANDSDKHSSVSCYLVEREKSDSLSSFCRCDTGRLFVLHSALTWMPPTPMTKSSWLMKRVARRLSSVVPANDLKSLNRLRIERRRSSHYLACCFVMRNWILFFRWEVDLGVWIEYEILPKAKRFTPSRESDKTRKKSWKTPKSFFIDNFYVSVSATPLDTLLPPLEGRAAFFYENFILF